MSYENIMTSKKTGQTARFRGSTAWHPLCPLVNMQVRSIPEKTSQLYRVVCFTLVSISPSNWVNALQTSKSLRGESKSLHCFCYFCWGCSFSCHWFKDYYSSPHEAHLTCHLKTVKSPCWECGEFGWNLLTSEGGISKSNSRGLPPTKTRASFNVINAHWNTLFFCENDVKVCQDANCTKWITFGWMRSSLRIQYDE